MLKLDSEQAGAAYDETLSLTRRVSIALIFAATVLLGHSSAAKAQAQFDGWWSVLIITEAGDCAPTYRYGLRIERGRVFYDGDPGIDVSGRVDRNGRVTVTIRRGGTGRLSGNSGTGTWKGTSSTGRCSGRWVAERR